MSEPKSITLSRSPKGIAIEWDDGHRGIYPFPYLRQACPCAVCKGEKMPQNLPPAAFEAKDMFKVGRYAVGFKWGDGHETGIYTFDYLRKICACETCLTRH